MKKLSEFELTANPDTFKSIFGEGYRHLWNKFANRYNHSILSLYRVLDNDNQNKLLNFLNF